MTKTTRGALMFGAIACAGFVGYRAYLQYAAFRVHYDPIGPGRVTLLGVNLQKGYRIIVSNQLAQLVEGNDQDQGPSVERSESTSDTGAVKRRLPLSEVLLAMQGDLKALSQTVEIMNDRKKMELPPVQVLWESADVIKALDGDPVLRKKLEDDLNCELDGKPYNFIRERALFNGIVIKVPVELKFPINGKPATAIATVLQPYRPQFALEIESKIAEKSVENANNLLQGMYLEVAKPMIEDPSKRRDNSKVLRGLLERAYVQQLARTPEQLLNSVTVVLNDRLITGSSYEELVDGQGRPAYTLKINLNSEGKGRVWQFSAGHVGSQLLLVVDGIAIAAPTVRHVIADDTIDITNLRDKQLVEDAVEIIKDPAHAKKL